MNTETSNAAWLYFRLFIGVMLVGLFVFLVATDSEKVDLVSRLWLLIVGFLETGSGILAFRAGRSVKK